MDLRFNSFYKDSLPPFVDSLIRLLTEAASRSGRPAWLTWMQWSANKKFDEDNAYFHEVASDLIEWRRANPTDKKDLLNAMINGKDPATGKTLCDDTIIDNMITFLIAGKGTTIRKDSPSHYFMKLTLTDLLQGTRLLLACSHFCSRSCCNIPRPTASCNKRSILWRAVRR